MQVLADGVAVSEPKDPGDIVCVDQVRDEDAAGHGASLHLGAEIAYACDLSVRPKV